MIIIIICIHIILFFGLADPTDVRSSVRCSPNRIFYSESCMVVNCVA